MGKLINFFALYTSVLFFSAVGYGLGFLIPTIRVNIGASLVAALPYVAVLALVLPTYKGRQSNASDWF